MAENPSEVLYFVPEGIIGIPWNFIMLVIWIASTIDKDVFCHEKKKRAITPLLYMLLVLLKINKGSKIQSKISLK